MAECSHGMCAAGEARVVRFAALLTKTEPPPTHEARFDTDPPLGVMNSVKKTQRGVTQRDFHGTVIKVVRLTDEWLAADTIAWSWSVKVRCSSHHQSR